MFHFGTSMEPLVFDELALSGWLLHRDGKPINGIRIKANDGHATDSSLFPLAADASPAPLPRDLRRIFSGKEGGRCGARSPVTFRTC